MLISELKHFAIIMDLLFRIILVVFLLIHSQAFGALKSPPSFKHTAPQTVVYSEGDKVSLPCVAKGTPFPTVTWSKDGKPLTAEGPNIIQRRKGTLVIRSAEAIDEGLYQCIAKNEHGLALSVFMQLIRAELGAFAEHPVIVHNPRVGESLSLNCTPPDSVPEGSIYWVEKPTPFYNAFTRIDTEASEGRITVDYNGNLHFANVQATDARSGAVYSCVLQNEALQSLVMGNEHIVQPIIPRGDLPTRAPKLVYMSPLSSLSLKGDTAKLKCIFSGFPTPAVHWRRLETPLPEKIVLQDSGAELVLPDVDISDMGRYRCVAVQRDSGTMLAQEVELKVEVRPYWITEPEDIIAAEEGDVIVDCEAAGVPSPKIDWYLNGIKIQERRNDHMLVGQNQINFLNLDPMMSSVVQCNASNKHGYIYKNAVLNVLTEPPTFSVTPQAEVETTEGANVELECHGNGSPKPSITWKKNDQPVNNSAKYRIMKRGNLRIVDITYDDEGIYTCQLGNKYGEAKSSAIIVIRRLLMKSQQCAEKLPKFIVKGQKSPQPLGLDPCQPPIITEIRFEGDGYIMFDQSLSHSMYFTHVEFFFKTNSWNGIFLYVGHHSRRYYLLVALREGKLVYEYSLGSGSAHIESLQKYNDGVWHNVIIRRFYWNGLLEIDNMTVINGRSPGIGSHLLYDYILIGGFNTTDTFNQGYQGCIKNLQLGVKSQAINFNNNKDFFRAFSGCNGHSEIHN